MTKDHKLFRLSTRSIELLLRHAACNVAYLNLDGLLDAGDTQVFRCIPRLSTRLKFSTGEIVYPNDKTRTSLLILSRGAINIFVRHGSGRTFVKKIEPHSVLGNMTGTWGQTMMDCVAVAAGLCEVFVLDESSANLLLDGWPKLHQTLSDITGTRLVGMTFRYRDAAFDNVPSMLAKLLLIEADEHGVIRLTHDEIADRLGVHRQTISRTLRWMKRKRLVDSKWRQITIVDREGLRELVMFPDWLSEEEKPRDE